MEWFKSHVVAEIPTSNKPIVDAHLDDTIRVVLHDLKQNNILSVAVYDQQFQYVGFVSVHDIMVYVSYGKCDGELNDHEKDFSLERLDHPISSVMIPERDTNIAYIFDSDTPIGKLIEAFTFGVHRVLVRSAEDAEKFIIVSQSDLIAYLYEKRNQIGVELMEKKVVFDIDEDLPDLSKMYSVTTADSAFTAIRIMSKCQIHAVPVLHQTTNEIVTTFSSSDIKKMDFDKLDLVNLPILDFLWMINHEIVKPLSVENGSHTVAEVMEMITANRVHRVWITKNHHLFGVCTLTDLAFIFLDLKELFGF